MDAECISNPLKWDVMMINIHLSMKQPFGANPLEIGLAAAMHVGSIP